MTDVFRTPDERFADLPEFPYEPRYVDVDGLRLHHLDEGSGAPVLCFHGEPSWSYLYRHMLDPLVAGGHRALRRQFDGLIEQVLRERRPDLVNPGEVARALNLLNESYLLDAFGREPRVSTDTAVQTLTEIWLGVMP